jgi:mannose/fructose/N-acetylgalactosamine-specific phosphotransferase system component IIB
VPYLKADEIVVVSDEIPGDDIRRVIMRFSTPEGVELKIMTVDAAFAYLNGVNGSARILVLLPGLKGVTELLSRGLAIRSLNIGGMHYSAGKNFSIGKAIFLSEEDRAYLRFIVGAGVELEGRGVPTDKAINLMDAIA